MWEPFKIFTDSVYLLPIFIFVARVIDVTIGTFRIICLTRGMRYLPPILGFFEILIWLTALGQLVQHLNSFTSYLSFAGGFATGNFVGIYLENKLALGVVLVRTITPKEPTELLENLKSTPFGLTTIEATGKMGKVKVIYTIVPRRDLTRVIEIIHQFSPDAFYSIEDVRAVREGVLLPGISLRRRFWNPLRFLRKGE